MTTIEPLTLPTFNVHEVGTPLLGHQAVVERRWDSLEAFLLTAGTGSGKTLAAFLPALRRGESVLAAYPTNALLHDQAGSIADLANLAGQKGRVIGPLGDRAADDRADVEIVAVDGPTLDAVRKEMGAKRKGEALNALLRVSSKPKIVVMNPDVLYLMASMCYRDSQSALTRLSRYSTIVLDEFHLYTGIELARLRYLVYLLQFLGGRVSGGLRRVAMLSATPLPEVLGLLRQVMSGLEEITVEATPPESPSGLHTAVHTVRFSTELTEWHRSANEGGGDWGLVEVVARFLRTKRDSLRLARRDLSRTVPGLVFLNSVVEAIRLEHVLLADGWTESELGSVRGLMSQRERFWQGKTIVVATAAAEVGIDFDCRLLVFEASDLGAFIQRLGRAGRHADAEAYLVGRAGAPGVPALGDELLRRPETLSRRDFFTLAASVLPVAKSYADFLTSKEGVFAAASLTEHILRRVTHDYGADRATRDRVRQTLLAAEKSYFAKWQAGRAGNASDVSRIHLGVRCDMERAEQGRSATQGWMRLYLGNFPSFRSQTLQVKVFDEQEDQRGREPVYRADLRTLARWAQLGGNQTFRKDVGLVLNVTQYANRPHPYCVVLHRPAQWPATALWPPDGLFWIGREPDVASRVVTATLVSDSTGGRFPGPFPPGEEPMLALVVNRDQLEPMGFDWRLQTWPLRRRAGTAKEATPRVVLLGDACLLAKSRLCTTRQPTC